MRFVIAPRLVLVRIEISQPTDPETIKGDAGCWSEMADGRRNEQ